MEHETAKEYGAEEFNTNESVPGGFHVTPIENVEVVSESVQHDEEEQEQRDDMATPQDENEGSTVSYIVTLLYILYTILILTLV